VLPAHFTELEVTVEESPASEYSVYVHALSMEQDRLSEIFLSLWSSRSSDENLVATFVAEARERDEALQAPSPVDSFADPIAIGSQLWWQPPRLRNPHRGRDGLVWATPVRLLRRIPDTEYLLDCDYSWWLPHERGYWQQLEVALDVVHAWETQLIAGLP